MPWPSFVSFTHKCQGLGPTLGNRDEAFDKTEGLPLSMERSVYEGNEGKQILQAL